LISRVSKPDLLKPTRNLSWFGGFFDIPQKQEKLEEIQSQIESSPNFWNNPEESAPILKQKKLLEDAVKDGSLLKQYREDLKAAIELAQEGEDEYATEADQILSALEKKLRDLEVKRLLGGELDGNDAILTINAGAGGTESCDWANMLLRMYLRYAERKGWQAEIFDILDGEGAGIKNATIGVSGHFAFGMLKAESGVHRLVRISPYDSNARRHTSFASVYVTPVVDDNIDIQIVDSDLKVDTYRASGAGGQHVNRTDSAVRITHIPTGVVVACQTQRSQHQNRAQAMKMLKSKLYEREIEARKKKQEAQEAAKAENSFGSQIRSYVLHPYKLVKDHRTDHENRQPDEVLDGDLDDFVNEYLINSVIPNRNDE
jgi:peptide chain release factor 2